nr:RNA-binding S4 domain-containing protein [Prochlorococcus sp. MIT 1223]
MKLNQFLKFQGLVSTGGEAKQLINSGLITVNGIVETRRGRKLCPGDLVSFENQDYILAHSDL